MSKPTPNETLEQLKEYLESGLIEYKREYMSNGGFDYWYHHYLIGDNKRLNLSNYPKRKNDASTETVRQLH